jgi:hypothetical protein
MSKVDLAVWRRPARAVCEVLMTKVSCFALAAADMKHVQQVDYTYGPVLRKQEL